MFKRLLTYTQYLIPQHTLSSLVGWLANSRTPWIKNTFINQFIRSYKVSLNEAIITNPGDYPTFNDFFIRELKPGVRPISEGLASPVDGTIAQIGNIHKNQLIQAKGMYFDLETLLGNDSSAKQFYDGAFTTLYLAPHNYHRIHMPLDGKLIKTIYVPGHLFSVNTMTSTLIPNLYARNERLICIFETEVGPMAVILVGALIVGSIQTSWMNKPIRSNQIITESYAGKKMNKGDELGMFKLGSTVILLYGKDAIEWSSSLPAKSLIQVGQQLGSKKSR